MPPVYIPSCECAYTAGPPYTFSFTFLKPFLDVQGNCTEPPSQALLSRAGLAPGPGETSTAVPLIPLKPGQCLLLTDSSALYVRQGPLWVDNIYFRLRTTERTLSAEFEPALVSVTDGPTGQVYLTNVTLQGSNSAASTGLYVSSSAYSAGEPS